jgi:hypothetical protein
MDQEMLKRHLAEAEEHIAAGDKNIARQRDLIAQLERDGMPKTVAPPNRRWASRGRDLPRRAREVWRASWILQAVCGTKSCAKEKAHSGGA